VLCLNWVICVSLAAYRRLPLYPHKQTSLPCVGMSQMCRFCCKSRKSSDPKNLAKVDLSTSSAAVLLFNSTTGSLVDFGCNDMVPHVAARKTHQRLYKVSFVPPKKILQQYLPIADMPEWSVGRNNPENEFEKAAN
jgi:hypothetical protein